MIELGDCSTPEDLAETLRVHAQRWVDHADEMSARGQDKEARMWQGIATELERCAGNIEARSGQF